MTHLMVETVAWCMCIFMNYDLMFPAFVCSLFSI